MFANTRLAISYGAFAFIAAAANIGAQDLIVRAYRGAFAILISLVVGTAVGLAVKYILDKRYIFRFRARSAAHDARTFVLYTIMGLVTTVVFWGFEFGFNQLFASKEMRYLGGAIGLAIGYLAKYRLDKRYVFRTSAV
jgi:putative flippase GtrA